METLSRHLYTPHNSSSRPSTSGSIEIHTPGSHQAAQYPDLYLVDCNSLTRQSNSRRSDLVNRLTNNADILEKEFANKLETRKRKLNFQRNAESIPMPNEKTIEILNHNDDDFYNSIDLDLVEAQATALLRQKARTSAVATQPPLPVMNSNAKSVQTKDNIDSLYGPSFDLGF
jgi:hypothetical protein